MAATSGSQIGVVMRGTKLLGVLLLALGSLLSGCSEDKAATPASTLADAGPRVVVEALSDVAARAGGSAAADVVPLNDSTLSAELSAKVLEVHADAGTSVKRGERLIELDPADFRLALSQADAQIGAAKAAATQADGRLARARELHGKHYVSDDELSDAVTRAEAAKADLRVRQAARAVAARQLEKATVLAPFDGVVVTRMAQVGNTVAAGTPLMRLIDLATPHVEVRLQPEQAADLASADAITIELSGQSYPLAVVQVAEATDPGSRTRMARLTFIDQAAQPGLSGTLHWKQQGFEVPTSLLVQRDGKLGLFTEQDGKAHWIAIAGASAGRAVMADLAADLPIVTHGQQSLQEGDPIAKTSTVKSPAEHAPGEPAGAR